MKKFDFWVIWLNIVSVFFTLFGILLALFNQTSFFDVLFNNNINSVFWGNTSIAIEMLHFQQWIYGVLGATCAGWGIIIWFIVNNSFKKMEHWAWNCILTGILLWFVFDESISLYFKVYFNAAFNLVLILAIIVPLVCTRKYFDDKKRHNVRKKER